MSDMKNNAVSYLNPSSYKNLNTTMLLTGFWDNNRVQLGSTTCGIEERAWKQENPSFGYDRRECKILEECWCSCVWFSSLVDSFWTMEFVSSMNSNWFLVANEQVLIKISLYDKFFRWDYYMEGQSLIKSMNPMIAYQKGLTTWAKWIDLNLDPRRNRVIFRSMSPRHNR